MPGKLKAPVLVVALFATMAVGWKLTAGSPSLEQQRATLTKAHKSGNFKDAYEGLRKLALNPKNDPLLVGKDLDLAITCLQRLGRVDEVDEFREAVIDVHKNNWRLLETAATSYTAVDHNGHIIAGKFYRGHRKGGGKLVNSMPRDRVRALQLMDQALQLTKDEKDNGALARFHLHYANMLVIGGGYHESWRLQYLTDLSKLPDYEEGYYYYRGQAAPVDAEGNPVYHTMPKGYETAQSDGQRWRWLLARAGELDPGRLNETDTIFADFLRGQFDVQTMANFGFRGRNDDDQGDKKTGTFQVHTLKDNETIARLANGVKRFSVPDEFNWITVYQRVAKRGKTEFGQQAYSQLAQVFEDRRQYPKAAEIWKQAIADYGPGINNFRQDRLAQLVNNWGRFEPISSQPAGTKATVDFRFRNGNKVSFEATEIKVAKLLDDVKAYLKGSPNQLDWNHMNIGNIGYRLVERREQQYMGDKVASWDLDLKPRPDHVDNRVTVTTPLKKPGAYLLSATMAGGNVSRVIVWVSDTVILKKQLDGQAYYFVAEAVSGQPVPQATVDFFGWKQIQVKPNTNQYQVLTTAFTETTDKDGQILLGANKVPDQYQWLTTVRPGKAGQDGVERFAYMGFNGIWFGRVYDPEYNQTRVLAISDRPVYRPEQNVQFKLWVRHAKYDQADTSSFGGQDFTVQITNPKGEKVFDKSLKADDYGGLAGDLFLPKGATLGTYQVYIPKMGGGNFRVEEYKKPEFEVKIEAPTEPVALGETINATIQAKYYFGAPVSKAKIKYKVMRTSHTSNWYPRGAWDWFYGSGYWWFAADYPWYPGWAEWGCRRPTPWWWGGRREAPEVVLEGETDIGADGTFKVAIDTLPAKELHPNQDHNYAITAEVVDESRRTIVGTGSVLVARKPFKVYTWLDRGFYRAGDTVKAFFTAQTLDRKAVEGKGELTLLQITYNDKNEPVEKTVGTWKLDTDAQGQAKQQLKAAQAGQYRLSFKVTDAKKHTIEGGYVFVVRGDNFTGKDYRFNDIELTSDKREYQPGEKVQLQINTNKTNGTVLLFVRPTNSVYLAPKVLRLEGKSTQQTIDVIQRDMPNFFVEVVTVADGRVHTDTREVIVPPEKRVLGVEVLPSQQEYKPGQKASMKIKLTDFHGQPFVGSTAVTVYDKSVEYISGGSNVPEIKEFFWKWRRQHHPSTESSLPGWSGNLVRQGERSMGNLGIFGELGVEESAKKKGKNEARGDLEQNRRMELAATPGMAGGYAADRLRDAKAADGQNANGIEREAQGAGGETPLVQPTVRRNFADTAFWSSTLTTNKDGIAEIFLTMPENLTAWKVKVWAMGHGTKVGQGEVEVTTKKDLIVRLQAPRFFVQKDEVVLSANVHNYMKKAKKVHVSLELDGGTLVSLEKLAREVTIPAGGEQRVDWRVKVQNEGEAIVRMKALSDEDSDAMEMRFPCFIHGMLKVESFTGVIRPEKELGMVTFNVPAERRINDTRLEVRYSPSLAAAMTDALPYMVEYPYGCTEQTLNRFLPTVITQRILQGMKLDLKAIQKHRTNLNAQEIGNDKDRLKGWKRFPRNPVFDEEEVKTMANAGVQALASMQLSDGGWGWFSGWGERSYPHTTAVVVHGLQIAKQNGIVLPNGLLEHGIDWLRTYQGDQVQRLKNFATKTKPYKEFADNIDSMVYMTLVDSDVANDDMREFLYRDRTHLAVYAKAMYGLTLFKQQQGEKLAMILKNIEQYVVQDNENQTAYLRLPENNYWWYWYGNEIEANAYYLKLLSKTNPKDEKAAGLVKYLLNNRKHATYWNSTRDTAICIEAMADYLKASGEDRPDMTVEVWLDGKKFKEVKIDTANLFTYDNKFVLEGDAVETGKHKLELKKKGTGPLYWNAYLTNFTLEDFITRAGLEVRVNRKYYKLNKVEQKTKVPGSKGQVIEQKVEKYERAELANLALLKSGDLVEVELEIDSKNDYEYIIFEDMKASGFEPVDVRSGYTRNGMGAYMELRDEKVCFFIRALPRGKHSVSYRMRAEIPGQFSALPTRAYAMYAPELRGNSDEIKLRVQD